MRIAVLGAGATGSRAVRQLMATPAVDGVEVADLDEGRAEAVAASMADPRARAVSADGRWWDGATVVVLAHPGNDHAPLARHLAAEGISVVSTSPAAETVRALLALDPLAAEVGASVVAGSGFSPGLSCLLVAHAAATFDSVDEVHVARTGWGGPACAEQAHLGTGSAALDWRDGEWAAAPTGARELCWFPDPIGARECGPAAGADALVLVPALPGVQRATSRLATRRRARLVNRVGRAPRGGADALGAIRIEVRGRRASVCDAMVVGAVDRPAVAAGAVAALAAVAVAEGRVRRPGAGGLAELATGAGLLAELSVRGVKGAVFEGSAVGVGTMAESV